MTSLPSERMCIKHIRNFSIIAHIDHGKSTLADRLIQHCGGLSIRELKEQVLDNMDIERERGITIKAQTVQLTYRAKNNQSYQLNLMDTPGHVDFSYEVSRSLAACEGSVLVVDSSQGVEAQTLANVYQAIDNNHEIMTVLNKIDLPAANPERVKHQIETVVGLDAADAIPASAKTGDGIQDILEAIVQRFPPPQGNPKAPLKALLIDSWYDAYLGIVILVRIKDGILKRGQKIHMISAKATYQVDQVGIFTPKKVITGILSAGEVGFFTGAIKSVSDCRIGDTITVDGVRVDPFPGFKASTPVVFCGLFPVEAAAFETLRDSLSKLHLNDASFQFETESSTALGYGFRCGFLGLLHLEIIQERLQREFGLDLVTTVPSIVYHLRLTDKSQIVLHNPSDMPDWSKIQETQEPWIKATILLPSNYLGAILNLCKEKRGIQVDLTYLDTRVMIVCRLPLNEVVFDFYDRLKSLSRGYASFDYESDGYLCGDLVRINLLVNGDTVDALSFIAHRTMAEKRGRLLCQRLKELIPRHQFKIPIQAAIGGKVIARETISAVRKDVTAKCYGRDATRKRKLLEKQKAGKKKLRQFGKVNIPQSAFIAVLKTGDT